MRWIALFLWLMLAACSLHQVPAPLNATVQVNATVQDTKVRDTKANETVTSKESGFFNHSQDVEWLSSQTDPAFADHSKIKETSPDEMAPLTPRLFSTHYDWPYLLYSVRYNHTLRHK